MPPQDNLSVEQQRAIAVANARLRLQQSAPPAGPARQMERDTATMQAKVQQRQKPPENLQYIPSYMGVAPPSNMMLTQGGMYAPNPNARQESLEGLMGAFNYAAAPYATAAAAGGAAGAPFGGIGAPIGAATGMLALGATDLLGGAYNAIVPQFGGSRLTLPSELIRNTMVGANLAKVPETPGERIVSSGVNTAALAIPTQQATNMVGNLLKNAPGVIGATGQVLARPVLPAVSAVSGAAGGLTSQAATEMGADPTLAAAIGVLGSVATGTLGAPKMPATVAPRTAAQLKAMETGQYDIAHGQGVEFLPAQVDFIANQSVRDAVNPNHPRGPVSAAAIPSPIVNILREMQDFAANKGRLDSRDVDTFRQKIGAALNQLEGPETIVGRRILEGLDEYTSNASLTLNEIRGRVARTRADVNANVTAADAARSKLQDAELKLQQAEQAFDANRSLDAARARNEARKTFESAKQASDAAEQKLATVSEDYLTSMRAAKAVDPDMKEVNAALNQAQTDYNIFTDKAKKLVDEYDGLINEWTTRSPKILKEVGDLNAKLPMLLRNDPDKKLIQTRNAIKKVNDLTAELTDLRTRLATLRPKVLDAEAELDPLRDALNAAKQRVDARLAQLTQTDDVATRVSERNAALRAGRKLHPTRLMTEDFERIPKTASLLPAGATGDTARALRQELRSYVQNMGDKFDRLPNETRRQIRRFINGGGITQSFLQSVGNLSPGFGPNTALGNAFSAAMTAVGMGAGGTPGAALTLLGTAAATQAARGLANRTAVQDFNRLRDLVSSGAGAPQPVPRSDVQNMLNYLLTQANQQEPR